MSYPVHYQTPSGDAVITPSSHTHPSSSSRPSLSSKSVLQFSVDESTPLLNVVANASSKKIIPDYRNDNFIMRILRPHGKKIKVGILLLVLLLGIVAFASEEEPEVDNIFALSESSPLISLHCSIFFSFIFCPFSLPLSLSFSPRTHSLFRYFSHLFIFSTLVIEIELSQLFL